MDRNFGSHLLKDEKLLWTGQPGDALFSPGDFFLVPFSLLWGGCQRNRIAALRHQRPVRHDVREQRDGVLRVQPGSTTPGVSRHTERGAGVSVGQRATDGELTEFGEVAEGREGSNFFYIGKGNPVISNTSVS